MNLLRRIPSIKVKFGIVIVAAIGVAAKPGFEIAAIAMVRAERTMRFMTDSRVEFKQ